METGSPLVPKNIGPSVLREPIAVETVRPGHVLDDKIERLVEEYRGIARTMRDRELAAIEAGERSESEAYAKLEADGKTWGLNLYDAILLEALLDALEDRRISIGEFKEREAHLTNRVIDYAEREFCSGENSPVRKYLSQALLVWPDNARVRFDRFVEMERERVFYTALAEIRALHEKPVLRFRESMAIDAYAAFLCVPPASLSEEQRTAAVVRYMAHVDNFGRVEIIFDDADMERTDGNVSPICTICTKQMAEYQAGSICCWVCLTCSATTAGSRPRKAVAETALKFMGFSQELGPDWPYPAGWAAVPKRSDKLHDLGRCWFPLATHVREQSPTISTNDIIATLDELCACVRLPRRAPCSPWMPSQLFADGGLTEALRDLIENEMSSANEDIRGKTYRVDHGSAATMSEASPRKSDLWRDAGAAFACLSERDPQGKLTAVWTELPNGAAQWLFTPQGAVQDDLELLARRSASLLDGPSESASLLSAWFDCIRRVVPDATVADLDTCVVDTGEREKGGVMINLAALSARTCKILEGCALEDELRHRPDRESSVKSSVQEFQDINVDEKASWIPKSSAAMNLTPQQLSILLQIVDGHRTSGGAEFFFTDIQPARRYLVQG